MKGSTGILRERTVKELFSSIGSGLPINRFLWDLLSITIDGTAVSGVTIDGDQVQEITVDGTPVWSATNVNEITTDVNLNGQSISVKVYEDTDGDGNAENTDTISVGEGNNTYGLSGLDGGAGNTYWIEWQISNSNINKTAKANSADLKDVGTWDSSTDWNSAQSESGVAHENVSGTDHDDSSVVKQGYSASSPMYSSSLVGYWPMHEDSGGTVNDYSGNSHDGSNQGPSVNYTGLLGTSAYFFNGSGDYIELPDLHPKFNSSPPATFAAWVKTSNSSDTQAVIGSVKDAYTRSGVMQTKNGYLSYYDASGDNTSSLTVADGNWHFVAVVDDGTDLHFYVDGSSDTLSGSSDGWDGGDYWEMGRRAVGDRYFDGKFCEVRAYSSALSSSEVQALYNVVTGQGTLNTATKSS